MFNCAVSISTYILYIYISRVYRAENQKIIKFYETLFPSLFKNVLENNLEPL